MRIIFTVIFSILLGLSVVALPQDSTGQWKSVRSQISSAFYFNSDSLTETSDQFGVSASTAWQLGSSGQWYLGGGLDFALADSVNLSAASVLIAYYFGSTRQLFVSTSPGYSSIKTPTGTISDFILFLDFGAIKSNGFFASIGYVFYTNNFFRLRAGFQF